MTRLLARVLADGRFRADGFARLEFETAGDGALERLDEVEHERVGPVARAVEARPDDPFGIDDPGLWEKLGAELVVHHVGFGIEEDEERRLRIAKQRLQRGK